MYNYSGLVVQTTAGHDKGGLFLVVNSDRDRLYLANGKQRKLTNPKHKKLGHVSFVAGTSATLDIPHSDKALRRTLAAMKEGITFGKR